MVIHLMDGDRIIGSCRLHPKKTHIHLLWIAKEYRRQGLGTRLVDEMMAKHKRKLKRSPAITPEGLKFSESLGDKMGERLVKGSNK